MTAFPQPLPSPHDANPDPGTPTSSHCVSDAACLHSASDLLLPHLEKGQALDAVLIRSAMEDAFGASDGDGAWIWKDAYEAAAEALEVAGRANAAPSPYCRAGLR